MRAPRFFCEMCFPSDADAFQLGEGSMLDALIRQLLGAELSKDGRIYVNGKFSVEKALCGCKSRRNY